MQKTVHIEMYAGFIERFTGIRASKETESLSRGPHSKEQSISRSISGMMRARGRPLRFESWPLRVLCEGNEVLSIPQRDVTILRVIDWKQRLGPLCRCVVHRPSYLHIANHSYLR